MPSSSNLKWRSGSLSGLFRIGFSIPDEDIEAVVNLLWVSFGR